MTKLYFVWILRVYSCYEIDVMRILTSPESTEAEGEIAILGYGYPVANDIYPVVAILLAVCFVGTQRWHWLLGQDTVYPVYMNHLVVKVALLIVVE